MGETEALRVGVIARQLADGLVSLLLAPSCAACGAPLATPTSGPVCADCWRAVPLLIPPLCGRCGLPIPSLASSPRGCCGGCERAAPFVDLARAAGAYAGSLREIVHALKYQKRRSLGPRLGELIASRCRDVLAGADVLVPVPLHPARERERGFNQAALIARALPVQRIDALVRVRETASQTDLPAARRHANVRGAFRLRRGLPADRFARRACVLLVDDVATTGATLNECAKVLKEAGAGEVRAVTAARAL